MGLACAVPDTSLPRSIGRYLLFGEIAAGGMATVHWGRLSGAAGFARTVAIKRLHPNFARDSEFVGMFLDEAHLAARVRHPNVVPTLDVVSLDGEIFVAMEYVHGESLSKLFRASVNKRKPMDPRIITSIMSGVLHGLHAAHEAKDEQGQLLSLVHRDVSPHNILVGLDGVARVLDFGVAQAIGRIQSSSGGRVKGKLSYMAPEQLSGGTVTRQADVYAAAVVIWEALTGYRLFRGEHPAAIISAVLQQPVSPPSKLAPGIPAAFDRIVMRGLERNPAKRYATARDMALDLERCTVSASTTEVGEWVESLVCDELERRAALMAEVERASLVDPGERASMLLPTGSPSARGFRGSSPSLSLQSEVRPIALPRPPVQSQSRRRIALAGVAAAMLTCVVVLLLVAAGRGASSRPAMLEKAFSARVLEQVAELVAQSVEPTVPSGQPDSITAELAPPSGEPDSNAAEPTPLPGQPDSNAAEPAPPVSSGHEPEPPDLPPRSPLPARAPATALRAVAKPVRSVAKPARSVAKPAPRSAPKSKKADCTTPFTVDEKGHKHYKPACL